MTPLWLVVAAVVSQGSPEVRDEVLKLEDGAELRYAISNPGEPDGGAPRPLVLALHFGWAGELPPRYGRLYMNLLVAPALAGLDAVIVAPDAPEPSWTHRRSEAALLALVDHVRATHRVDAGRIVVTGFSLGAMGAWFMASRHPQLFSALIPMAGPPVLSPVADARAGLAQSRQFFEQDVIDWPPAIVGMPVFAIHSKEDELVDFELISRAVQSLGKAGGRVKFVKVKDLGHFDTGQYAPYLARAVPWLRDVWNR